MMIKENIFFFKRMQRIFLSVCMWESVYILLLQLPLIVVEVVQHCCCCVLGRHFDQSWLATGIGLALLCRLVFALLLNPNLYLCEAAHHACVLAMAETCQAISALSTIKFVFVLMSSQHDAPFGGTSLYFSDRQTVSQSVIRIRILISLGHRLMTFDSCVPCLHHAESALCLDSMRLFRNPLCFTTTLMGFSFNFAQFSTSQR